MNSLISFILLASANSGSLVQTAQALHTPAKPPVFTEVHKPSGLTLYNKKGEVVARCEQGDDQFSACKMEPGITLDDVMNAWVNAYQDLQK